MQNNITCPNCQQEIELTQALTHQLGEQIKIDTEKELRTKIASELELKIKDSQNESEELKKQNRELGLQILELSKSIRELTRINEQREIDTQKQILEAQQKTKNEIQKLESEKHQLKELENQKIINDLKISLDEMKRKAEQGSQQTQGEALELNLEKELKMLFPNDEINEVKKGIRGADFIQIVKTPMGNYAGTIIWESKHTKNWEDKWIEKLRQDQRTAKAEIAALISISMPKNISKPIINISKVWVCTHQSFGALAGLLRDQLLAVAKQKAISNQSADAATSLFDYITSHDFTQQIEAIIEVYLSLQAQISKEKIAFEKQWKQREMQIQKMYKSLGSIYGGITGIAGNSIPQIKGLEFGQLDDGLK